METFDDDDDTHFCIKCHATINGLDNYVRHRQLGCRSELGSKPEVIPDPPCIPATVTYPEILNADAFFSSLELQSSSKSNPVLTRPQTRSMRKRKVSRSPPKNLRRPGKVQQTEEGCLKEKLLNMPPVVADLDDLMDHLGIPSLVGFPEIVSTAATKSSPTTSGKPSDSHQVIGQDILRDSPLENLMTSSKDFNDIKKNQDTQRVDQDNSEWMEDPILGILDTPIHNKEIDSSELLSDAEYDYRHVEETDEESPEEDTSSDDDFGEDAEYSSRRHTGGKWKPSELLQDMSRLNEDELDQDDDNQEHPPPSHTGGKWKPADSSEIQKDIDEIAGKDPGASSSSGRSVTPRQQPWPGHTRGKWIPGAAGELGSGYWCDPCGRKLASRLLYNRHLLSDLHAKRSIQEIDGDLQLPRTVAPLLRRKSARKRQRAVTAIKSRDKNAKQNDGNGKKTRRREKEVLWCEMCHARVRRPQMGKHLLSHYHCRVAGTNPCSSPAASRFILENMGNVVRQCPFQCASCRFYCNTQETFMLHWRSNLHTKKFGDITGNYKCSACNFSCDNNETMENHLLGPDHEEVVAMFNGSVPIIISRQRELDCETCNQRFRYNVQLRFHVRETGHEGALSATDEYQSKIACGLCSQVVRSRVALQRHQLSCHGREEDHKDTGVKTVVKASSPYFCSYCMENFATANEAVLHRRTTKHKETVKVQKVVPEIVATLGRECPHCGIKQSSLTVHKEHLLQEHPELCHRCPRCGVLFALSQDVTRHTRTSDCMISFEGNVDRAAENQNEWSCTKCQFVSDSQAEFFFHEALHVGPLETNADEAGSSKALAKYQCPMCEKSLTKVSLRNHIRSHTGERPFRCVNCSTSFSRRSNLNAHRKECAPMSSSSSMKWPKEADSRHRNHICLTCDTAFYTKHALQQHMLRHDGKSYKCGLPGCPTILRTANELRSHRLLVHDSETSDRQFRCSDCPYAGKTRTQLRRHRWRHEAPEDKKVSVHLTCPHSNCNFVTKITSHLRRHIRLHTGTKPYKCRHCTYASNNLENLRKHVLSTSLHPGKTIYECDTCLKDDSQEPYRTNFAKELRAHLLEAHPQDFPRPSDASDHVARIFKTDQEPALTMPEQDPDDPTT